MPVVVESRTSIRAVWIAVPAKQKKKNIHLPLSRAMNCRMVPVDFTHFAVSRYRVACWPLLQLPWPRSTRAVVGACAVRRYTRQRYLLAGRQPLSRRH